MITSHSNEQVKRIRKLRERKERAASGLFYLEGLRIVGEAIETGADLQTLVVAPELLTSDFGLGLAARQRASGGTVLEVSAEVFERLALKEGPQGIAAVVCQRWVDLTDVVPEEGKPWVALEAVADPGNLGTILRTSDGAGGMGVILLGECSDPYDPAAMRASMGALFSQRLARAGYTAFADWKRAQGLTVVGTSDAAAADYHAYRYPDRLVVLMGSERQGLSREALALCDHVVSIPMMGRCDSLNLAAAAAVILYELVNQRRERQP